MNKDFKISTFFCIEKSKSHDIGETKPGKEYDYITRSVLNRGIARKTGFIDSDSLILKYTFSLELMNMTFFWREKDWYAGQFIRIVRPVVDEITSCWEYFETILSGISRLLRTILVRDVDDTFMKQVISLPIVVDKDNNPVVDKTKKFSEDGFMPDWNQIKNKIDEIRRKYIPSLKEKNEREILKYKKVTNIDMSKPHRELQEVCVFKEFQIDKIFNIYTGRDIIIRDTKKGNHPLISHTNDNNGISKYIDILDNRILFNHKKTISLADRGLFWASIHSEDFYIGTRVKALELKDGEKSENTLLYLATSINGLQKAFEEYLINATDKLPTMKIWLPILIDNGKEIIDSSLKYSSEGYIPDWNYMDKYIDAMTYNLLNNLINEKNSQIDKIAKYLGLK